MTRFLIHSNSPHTGTGYGTQCAHLCTFLLDLGHEVAVSSTYGTQGEASSWTDPEGRNVLLLPGGYQQASIDSLPEHAMYFFGGDPHGGVIITLLDQWQLLQQPALAAFRILAWTPVDHTPVPPEVLEFFNRTQATPLAMSKFGRDQLSAAIGAEVMYAPHCVDTKVFKRVEELDGAPVRDYFGVHEDAFVVLTVAANKDLQDRKGWSGMVFAMAQFLKAHSGAVWLIHAQSSSVMGGLDLAEIARFAGIDPRQMVFTNLYAQRLGFTPDMMAGLYSAADVFLLASRGEGFGVPLIEAQACGVPVIATDFSAMSELIGDGWAVSAQPEFDPMQRALYARPIVQDIVEQLELAHAAMTDGHIAGDLRADAVEFARQYDTWSIFKDYWVDIIDKVTAEPEPTPKRLTGPKMEKCDVIVPIIRSQANRERLLDSLQRTAPQCSVFVGDEKKTYAENVNERYRLKSTADWIVVVGDDCEFAEGWFEAAVEASQYGDVIGTNDSLPGRTRNDKVAAGTHADHFLIRRRYIEERGASLNGPGIVMAEEYGHWFTDNELIELAKARGVYHHAHDVIIEHHHPGYDGNESARIADPLYMRAVERAPDDSATWAERSKRITSK